MDEIRDGMRGSRFTSNHVVIEAHGQSLRELRRTENWQPLRDISPPRNLVEPQDGETWPLSESYRSPSEKFLAGIQATTAYPKVRRGVEIIEGLLIWGFLFLGILAVIFGYSAEGRIVLLIYLLIFGVVLFCVFYLIKHILLTLLDVSDLLIERSRKE